MVLRGISLQLDIAKPNQESIDYAYDFLKKSRHICNFINRECLRKIKYQTLDFNRIVINLTEIENTLKIFVNSENVLCVFFPFNRNEYDCIKDNDNAFREYIIKYIEDGCKVANENGFDVVPEQAIFSCIEILRKNNYQNEWLFKRRTDRKRKIVAELICRITINEFQLRLIVKQNNNEVFNKVILETDADEIAFYYKFKDIKINERDIVLTSRLSEPLCKIPIEEIGIS